MTASRRSRGRRPRAAALAAGLAALAALALLPGCATKLSAPPEGSALEPLPTLPVFPPDDADRAARDTARAALLADDAAAQVAIDRLEAVDREHREAGGAPTGLVPLALDARAAGLPEEARRAAWKRLLDRNDVSPELRWRIDRDLADDPLTLADDRVSDARLRRWGGAANLVMSSLGSAISQPVLLPVRGVQALVGIGVRLHLDDELAPAERQALAHWKEYVDKHPESPKAVELLERIEKTQERWAETRRDQAMRDARKARKRDAPAIAAAYAERALRFAPGDDGAQEMLDWARGELAHQDAERLRSLAAGPAPRQPAGPREATLLRALLAPKGDVVGAADALLAAEPEGPRADAARFARATALEERGDERAAWDALEDLADQDDARSPMARHARTAVNSLQENPYRGFRAARSASRGEAARWLFFGPLANGARDRDLPRPVEWLIEVPTVVPMLSGLPMRVLQAPFRPHQDRAAAVLARRYLERFPHGIHAAELRGWLVDFERDRGNQVGAYRLASRSELLAPGDLRSLEEDASQQALQACEKEKRRDVRLQLLQEVAREFPDTEGGRSAGMKARKELEDATPQHIRISRSFLLENPEVAGPRGLGLRPSLLDDATENGELHPDGVTLLGGRVVEFAFVGPSGDPDDPPELRRESISEERLARVAARLEESQARVLRTDRDAVPEPDADRDLYLERARLGITDHVDFRPLAASSYAYRSMRERYGLVRGRESILPVELVLQGSFEDFGLGAFPRVRLPKATPDQFLYR